jgi:hypothetical protein
MSLTFSINSGVADNLKVSVAHGFSPNARQTRATVGLLAHARCPCNVTA